ncbi:metal-dependent hydrolase [Pasteuria penetrans]|uniref:metal-dependent hydrolase n=1 Tax=Pasteuria penetrans TaxID=86005 RepID=UPI0011ECB1E6|nr:metal-dependent hydrolase [Pasteuria penetrans]
MKVTFCGHSCFLLEHQMHKIVVDPFLTGNPKAILRPDDVQVDWILLTHAHQDHLGDTIEIAKANGATVVTMHELGIWLGWQGVKTKILHMGGSFQFPFGHLKMIPAWHSSGLVREEEKVILPGGVPVGFLWTVGGRTLYHAGDTALFSDMRLINRGKPVDLALLPIGDCYTMGPQDAVLAAEFLGARAVIPCHYDTFPEIRQDPERFGQALRERGIQPVLLKVGESHTLKTLKQL